MLMLTITPFLLSLLLWGLLLALGLTPMIDTLHAAFGANDWFQHGGEAMDSLGLGGLRALMVPLLAMLLLLPVVIFTVLLFVGIVAVPSILRHVSARHYPALEKQHGGSTWGSAWMSLASFAGFAVLWILTLPLNLLPPFTFMLQPLLWGWLTYRVMAYDALAEHAASDERRRLIRAHRWPLYGIGVAAGVMSTAPALVWLAAPAGLLLPFVLPLLAALAIWLYVVVFVFSGLWFVHYSLQALESARLSQPAVVVRGPDDAPMLRDLN